MHVTFSLSTKEPKGIFFSSPLENIQSNSCGCLWFERNVRFRVLFFMLELIMTINRITVTCNILFVIDSKKIVFLLLIWMLCKPESVNSASVNKAKKMYKICTNLFQKYINFFYFFFSQEPWRKIKDKSNVKIGCYMPEYGQMKLLLLFLWIMMYNDFWYSRINVLWRKMDLKEKS